MVKVEAESADDVPRWLVHTRTERPYIDGKFANGTGYAAFAARGNTTATVHIGKTEDNSGESWIIDFRWIINHSPSDCLTASLLVNPRPWRKSWLIIWN